MSELGYGLDGGTKLTLVCAQVSLTILGMAHASSRLMAAWQDWKHLYPFPVHHDLDRRLVELVREYPRGCQSTVLIVLDHVGM